MTPNLRRSSDLQERALFKTKCVNGAEAARWYFGVAKTQFRLHAIGHRRIDLAEARPKLPREISQRGFFLLGTRHQYGVESWRWDAVQIASELACQNVPKRNGSKFGQCHVLGKPQAQPR